MQTVLILIPYGWELPPTHSGLQPSTSWPKGDLTSSLFTSWMWKEGCSCSGSALLATGWTGFTLRTSSRVTSWRPMLLVLRSPTSPWVLLHLHLPSFPFRNRLFVLVWCSFWSFHSISASTVIAQVWSVLRCHPGALHIVPPSLGPHCLALLEIPAIIWRVGEASTSWFTFCWEAQGRCVMSNYIYIYIYFRFSHTCPMKAGQAYFIHDGEKVNLFEFLTPLVSLMAVYFMHNSTYNFSIG